MNQFRMGLSGQPGQVPILEMVLHLSIRKSSWPMPLTRPAVWIETAVERTLEANSRPDV
jgi:hypothetical protein